MTITYRNPVWPGYLADPFVLRHASGYWAYGTGGPQRNGLQPDGRMFPLLHSADLVHWEYLGGALSPLDASDKPSYWAPEVAERDGTFYLYYSAGGHAGEGHQLRVATADCPEGPFQDSGALLMPCEIFSIDASPFRDPADGRWYLYFARDYLDGDRPGTGTAVVPLGDDMVSVAGEPVTVIRAQWDWQIFQRNRHWYGRDWPAWHTVEGPFVILHDGRYYCLYSGGGWETADYGVGFGVADSPLGPFDCDQDADGPSVLRAIPNRVLGPGHCSVVLGPDNATQFLVYHAWDLERSARRMCVDPLLWTPRGPRCGGPSGGRAE